MITQTEPTRGKRLVDADELICPGCGEQVRCAPPAVQLCDSEDGMTPWPLFSHRNTTPLCRRTDGRPAEPVELVAAVEEAG